MRKGRLFILAALLLSLATAFAGVAYADAAVVTLSETVYQGEYSADGMSGDACVFFATVQGSPSDYGIVITGQDDEWTYKGKYQTDGKFGIALFEVPAGEYFVKAYADGVFSDEIRFVAGSASFSVTWDFDGGKDSEGRSSVTQIYYEGESLIVPTGVSRDGFIMNGYDKNLPETVTEDVTFTAKWIEVQIVDDFEGYDDGNPVSAVWTSVHEYGGASALECVLTTKYRQAGENSLKLKYQKKAGYSKYTYTVSESFRTGNALAFWLKGDGEADVQVKIHTENAMYGCAISNPQTTGRMYYFDFDEMYQESGETAALNAADITSLDFLFLDWADGEQYTSVYMYLDSIMLIDRAYIPATPEVGEIEECFVIDNFESYDDNASLKAAWTASHSAREEDAFFSIDLETSESGGNCARLLYICQSGDSVYSKTVSGATGDTISYDLKGTGAGNVFMKLTSSSGEVYTKYVSNPSSDWTTYSYDLASLTNDNATGEILTASNIVSITFMIQDWATGWSSAYAYIDNIKII